MESYKLSTYKTAADSSRKYQKFCSNRKLVENTAIAVDEFTEHLNKSLAPGTVKLYMTHVKKYVEVTYKKKIRLRYVQRRPQLKHPHRCMSKQEIEDISTKLSEHRDYHIKTSPFRKARVAINFMYDTCARIEDANYCTWGKIIEPYDKEYALVDFIEGKTTGGLQ